MKDISRRDLLKQFGLAGLMMLPVLRQTRSFAADFTPIYCQVFKPLGSVPGTYYPNGEDKNFNFMGKTPQSLAGLEEYLIVPRGLTLYKEKGNPHSQGICRNFTNSSFSTAIYTDDFGPPVDPSIDHIIANHLATKKKTLLKHINFAVAAGGQTGLLSTTSFPGNQTMKLPELSVMNMYKTIADPITAMCGGNTAPSLSADDLAKKSILDYHLNNIAASKNALNLSVTEKAKLDTYAEQLRALEQKISGLQGGSANDRACPVFPKNGEYPVPNSEYSKERSRVVFDLMALAIEWELTNVGSLMIGGAQDTLRYDQLLGLNVSSDKFHSISHHSSEKDKIDFNIISTFLWSEVAYFLNKLKNGKTFEGQSLLDAHCVLISGGDVSYGATHSYDDMPFIVAGKAGGAFQKTGYTFAVPKNNGLDSHGRLLLSVCHAMGLTNLQYVGDQDKCQGGPLLSIRSV